MQPDPMVTCVMLTRNREQMAIRAVECFRRQTWKRRRLLVLDDSEAFSMDLMRTLASLPQQMTYERVRDRGMGVGKLRQKAVRDAELIWPMPRAGMHCEPDVFCHWDDDDVSAPLRIEHQMEMLSQICDGGIPLNEGVAAYDRMLFWDQPNREAWEYRGGPLGTSLMYPRTMALSHPFPETDTGEDRLWLSQLRLKRVPIITAPAYFRNAITADFYPAGSALDITQSIRTVQAPAMIAGIHRTNHTSSAYDSERMFGNPQHWTRKAEYDNVCAERFV